MKIYYIANIRFPTEKAHGYQIAKMCEAFQQHQHELTLVVPTRKNPIQTGAGSFYGLRKDISVRSVRCWDPLPLHWLGPFAYFLQLFCFLARMACFSVEKDALIYTRSAEIAWLMKRRGRKVIMESHNWPKTKQWLHRKFLKNVDRIVLTTTALRQIYLEQGFFPEQCLVVPDGVDVRQFSSNLSSEEARRQLHIDGEDPVLCYTGSFMTMGRDKGIADILYALQHLSHVQFIAVGGTKKHIAYYKDMAQKLGVAQKVTFQPRVSIDTLALYQKAATLLLMPFPDIEHYRSFMSPLKMFEYMASDRPIISSDLPSIRDVLSEETAFFCQPSEPKNLAQVVEYVLSDIDEAMKRANRALHEVQQYSWHARAEAVLSDVSHI